MIEIRKTDLFVQWLDDLVDIQARARAQTRIERRSSHDEQDRYHSL